MKVLGSILLAAITAATGAAQGFTPAGDLADARLAHTATLLPDGRVFVAGGGQGPDLIDGFWVVPGAEIFDPATGTFSSAGISARAGHTATLLRSGQVLLVGGEVGWCGCNPYGNPAPIVSPSAELYNPATGQFSPTGSMSVERESHTATPLIDGRVLIAGGYILDGLNYATESSAEIYDPGTGTFSMTGSLNQPRATHTATLLADGRVLIAGGWSSNNTMLATAEIYDPATGVFTPAGSMNIPRANYATTLLHNGQVLLTGGSLYTGSWAADVYDPSTGSFTLTQSMVNYRQWHTSTLLPDGTVLVAGGWAYGDAESSAEIFDPATSSFHLVPKLNVPRFMHTATTLSDGSVLIIGGASTANPPRNFELTILSSTEIYTE